MRWEVRVPGALIAAAASICLLAQRLRVCAWAEEGPRAAGLVTLAAAGGGGGEGDRVS